MAACELSGVRQLLQQLGAEFEKVEVWVQNLHDENLRSRPADVSSLANGNSFEPSLQLQGGLLPAPETARSLTNGSSDIIDLSPHRDKVRSEESVAPQDEKSEPASPRTPMLQTESARLCNVARDVKKWSHDTVQFEQAEKDPFQDPWEEEAAITEMRMWYQKLLDKEDSGCHALTPGFIESLFIGTDGDMRRGESWVANAVSEFNAVVASMDAQELSLERSIVQRHMSTRKQVGMERLAFDSFVELMIWKTVEPHLTIKQKRNALQIREILVKHSIDELIYEFSGLAPPKAEKKKPWWSRSIEPAVAVVIIINAITIGISADYPWDGWEVCEFLYTSFFIFEIFLKLWIHGFRQHLCGSDMAWNLFDMAVVALAVFDLGVSLVAGSDSALGNFTLMRLARLAKLTRVLRVIRLIRLRFFKELLLLIRGVAAGIRTLAWAFVLLASLVYIVGIMLRQAIGEKEIVSGVRNIVLFQSMRASMFIVFRCLVGDCSMIDGTPLLVHLYELYGYAFVLPWALVTLFVTFGMFNLIMAVFVENVQENAKQKRELTRDDERATVVRRMRQLVMMFAGKNQVEGLEAQMPPPKQDSFGNRSLQNLKSFRTSVVGTTEVDATNVLFQFGGTITRDVFNRVISDPEVHNILDDLEVHVADRTELFDLLDADGNRVVDLSELIHGILKLRSGGADKSDIVGTILGIRSIQKQLSSFIEIALEQQASIRVDLSNQVAAMELMQQELRSDIRNSLLGHHAKLEKAVKKGVVSI